MNDPKIIKARYQFQKALHKLVEKYEDKGMKIKALDIKWDNDLLDVQSVPREKGK